MRIPAYWKQRVTLPKRTTTTTGWSIPWSVCCCSPRPLLFPGNKILEGVGEAQIHFIVANAVAGHNIGLQGTAVAADEHHAQIELPAQVKIMEDFGTGTHRQLGPVGVEGVGAYATVVIVPIAVEYTETPGCLLLQGIAVLQTHKNVVHTAGLLFGQHIQRQPQTQKGAARFVVVSLFGKAYIHKNRFTYEKPVLGHVHARKKGDAGPVAIEQLVERPCQIDAQSKALGAADRFMHQLGGETAAPEQQETNEYRAY